MLRRKLQDISMRKLKDNENLKVEKIQTKQKDRQSICIIGVSQKKPTDMILLKGAKMNFHSVLFVPISSIRLITKNGKIFVKYRETDLSKFDSVFIRVPESKYRIASIILDNLPDDVLKVQNPESFLITSNRLLLCQKLAKAGISVPKICFADTAEAASRSFSELRFPILVRVPFDKEKIMLAKNATEAKALMDTLETLKQPIFLEEFYTDVNLFQIFVVGGKVIGSLKIKAVDIGYTKGEISQVKVSGNIRRIATHACKVLDTNLARVDILDTPEPVVVDVDICPSLVKLKKISKEDIGNKIFERLNYLVRVRKGGMIVRFIEDVKLLIEDIFSF